MNTRTATNPGNSSGVAHDGGSVIDTTNTGGEDGHDTDDEGAEEGSEEEDTDFENTEGDGEDEGTDADEEGGDEEGDEEGDGDGQRRNTAKDTVEIEHDGKKFKVPAALKDSFLRQADYTQKTQQLAEDRRQLENREQASRTHVKELGKLYQVHETIEAYKKVDWDTLQTQDPDLAASEWRKFQLLKDQAGELAQNIHRADQQANEQRQRDHAKLMSDGQAILAKDIPGWSPELAGKLADYGVSNFGFSPDEIRAVTDPRMIKVLHAAMTNGQKAKTAAKVRQVTQQQQTRPAPQARSGSSASTTTKDPSKMSDAAYRKWRESQSEG